MGKARAEAFPESRAVFDEADEALGFSLSRLCFEGPEAELQLTANTQPALLAASVAALRPLVERGVRPAWVAGHSLGEYSAQVAAGALLLSDALRTVRRRGELMQEAVPVRDGVSAFVEVGPGTVLSGLVRKIAKGARVLNVDSPESLEAVVTALGAGTEA
jgi:[acyl-carrier-protein] S-malonyltransferase